MNHPRDRELARLVELGAVDEVLAMVSLETIADTWCTYHASDRAWDEVDEGNEEPGWWAVEFVIARIPSDQRRATLLALVASAQGDSRLLSIVGAGPFEDQLDLADPDEIAWIEHHAALSPHFQEALCNMRLSRDVDDDVRIRINRAAGFAPDRWLKYEP